MASVAVTYTFANGGTADASEVNSNFTSLTSYINNRNSGSATWDTCYVTATGGSIVPLVVNNGTSTGVIANFQVNGTSVVTFDAVGVVGINKTDPSNIVGTTAGGLVVKDGGRGGSTTQVAFQDSSGNSIYSLLANGTSIFKYGSTESMRVNNSGNFSLGPTPSFGGGSIVMFIANAATPPATDPSAGGILYVTGGALTYRGSSGTVSTIANA